MLAARILVKNENKNAFKFGRALGRRNLSRAVGSGGSKGTAWSLPATDYNEDLFIPVTLKVVR